MTPINQSIVRAFSLLNAFRSADEWLSAAELSRRANVPEASGYRLIETLEKVGAVVRVSRGRYRPGLFPVPAHQDDDTPHRQQVRQSRQREAAMLVSAARSRRYQDALRKASDGVLAELAERFGTTVHLGILEEGMVTYVAKHGRPVGLTIHTQVGAQLEPYCTGLGKVLLAAVPDRQLEEFIEAGEFVPLTQHTITSMAAFRAEIAATRTRGYAVDDRETLLEMRCLAVPVLSARGDTLAAISVADLADRMDASRRAAILEPLVEAARAIGQGCSVSSKMIVFSLGR